MLLGLSLGSIVVLVLSRSLPLLLQQHVYSCQTYIQSWRLEIFTCHIRNALLVIGVSLTCLITLRIWLVFNKVRKLEGFRVPLTRYQRLAKLAGKYQVAGDLHLIESPEIFAFCFGIRQPTIYLSTGLVKQMSTPELAAIILHERYHLQQRDSRTLFVASVMLMAFPFFPVLATLIGNYRLRAEIQADTAAVTFLNSKTPLISVLKKMLATPTSPFFAAAAVGDHALATRIQYLVSGAHTQPGVPVASLGVSLASVGILLAIVCMPATSVELPWRPTETSFCIGGKNCAITCSATRSVPMTSVDQIASPNNPGTL